MIENSMKLGHYIGRGYCLLDSDNSRVSRPMELGGTRFFPTPEAVKQAANERGIVILQDGKAL